MDVRGKLEALLAVVEAEEAKAQDEAADEEYEAHCRRQREKETLRDCFEGSWDRETALELCGQRWAGTWDRWQREYDELGEYSYD
jgi:hypothetical protein